MVRATILSIALAVAFAGPAPASTPGLSLGFQDAILMRMTEPALSTGLANARSAGATRWREFVYWSDVAPTRPGTPAEAADPAWSGYRWTETDRRVRAIRAAGLEPIFTLFHAPSWAEGPDRPSDAPRASWRPSPAWFGAFATAAAKRYSGRFPDPEVLGASLPRVRYWQAWNEPNLSQYITPQWVRSGGRWVPASPALYRRLHNELYRGVKSAASDNVVATAGTAPYGDLEAGAPRMPPMRFWRDLLCVKGREHPVASPCADLWTDVVAHHPYPIGSPLRRAINADDVAIPDLGKIGRLVAVAERGGNVRPRGPKPLWITEISWDSWPDPDGLSLAAQGRYLEGALNVLWKSGARVVVWFNLRDQAPVPSYSRTYQSGVFLRGADPMHDTPKPSFTASRFPFTAYRTSGVAELWGKAPVAGTVVVQSRHGTRWVDEVRLTTGSNRMFTGRLRVPRGVDLRAVSGKDVSLTWKTS